MSFLGETFLCLPLERSDGGLAESMITVQGVKNGRQDAFRTFIATTPSITLTLTLVDQPI